MSGSSPERGSAAPAAVPVPEDVGEDRPSPRADLFGAVVWLVFGCAIVYGSWTMDRLTHLSINPYTAPGLVPGILGGALIVMAVLLLGRSWRRLRREAPHTRASQTGVGGLAVAIILCLVYGAGLIGRGLPFWLATALFVFAFITYFEYPERRRAGTVRRGLVRALVVGVLTAAAVTYVFEDLFLVRLP